MQARFQAGGETRWRFKACKALQIIQQAEMTGKGWKVEEAVCAWRCVLELRFCSETQEEHEGDVRGTHNSPQTCRLIDSVMYGTSTVQ